MVIVKLQGGLGNQMFQYAAGRSLAIRLGTELKLDRSFLDGPQTGNTSRRYELGGLSIHEVFAESREVAKFTSRRDSGGWTFLLRLRQATGGSRGRFSVLQDRTFRFQPEFLSVSGDVYFDGYWQSEKYFIGIADVIRREFSTRRPREGRDRELAEEIAGEESVSVHVRRGDYVRSEEARRYHGVCDAEYYFRCMKIVSGEVRNPHFVVFTDEPGWARENIPDTGRITFVDWDPPRSGVADIDLMRRCRHHIIANSSFSWWGAWLCTNPGKRVLAPACWLKDQTIDTSDLLPESWARI